MKTEFKVWEKIQFGLVELECIEGKHTAGMFICNDDCFFRHYGLNYCHQHCVGYCDKRQRSDKKDVIFKLVNE